LVHGVVSSQEGPVPFASVALKGTTLGAAADIDGAYRLTGVQTGSYSLVASAIGFRTSQRTITLGPNDTLAIDIELAEAVIEADGITVTGTLVETFVRESPVKVNVVSSGYLEKVPTVNVMEVLENVNGLYQQIDCSVCGTNNIRVNGMDGPYTAVLIDGMPIMSSLATVYALNGISPALIQQIEVVKGPMSTLYGSEAMGGVVNIITKTPATAPSMSINTFANTVGEYAIDFGLVPSRGRLSTLLSGTLLYNDLFLDGNGDNFADVTLNRRASLFAKAALTTDRGMRLADLSARYYFEDRRGGTSEFIDNFSDDLRGSDAVYGETIRTNRVELVGSYTLNPSTGVRLDAAFNHHDQDRYYGADGYMARQSTGFAQLVWPLRLNPEHGISLGTTVRAQSYDDNTGATGTFDLDGFELENAPDNRFIPGVLGQYEWVPSKLVRLLAGLRLDHQRNFGVIPSPSLNVKLSPDENTTFRFNGGTGFRIVNLFTEDHAAYSGARAIVLLEDLDPERSINGTMSMQHTFDLGVDPLTIDLEGFYTYFTNKIEPDYSQPGSIVYRNLGGSATTRGVSLTVSQNMTSLPLTYTLGATVMDVFVDENGSIAPLEFAPDFLGVANLTYRLPRGVALDYTMNLTGPMKMPEYEAPFQRPPSSPAFSTHNLQLTGEIELSRTEMQLYAAVKNLFDYRQASPLIDPQNPFGPAFDTAYVYGPIRGRSFGVGIRLTTRY
jgi:outer membrane receptor for ferrienterochelin and colicins